MGIGDKKIEAIAAPFDATSATSAHASELSLACACDSGLPAALDEFDRCYMPVVDQVLHRLGVPAAARDDLRQDIRASLFVGSETSPPAIRNYRGGGHLRGWLRIVAVRMIRRSQQKRDVLTTANDDAVLETLVTGIQPELAIVKAQLRDVFSAAFRAAVGSLSERDRALLSLCVVDERSPEQVAAIYRVHRTTVVRWLARIQETLLSATRARLMASLSITSSEFDSAMRLIRSELALTFGGLLAGDTT